LRETRPIGNRTTVMSKAAMPIDEVLPQLRTALDAHSTAILVADPGAGKTTRVPLALLGSSWLKKQKIVMLEPRRIAARAAAGYMARLRGEEPGETVGYSVRLDSRISAKTQTEIVTEGVLTRRLQSDPMLGGTGLLIFDEFHERSLEADLGLALALEVQEALRPDLRILVMSATLEAERLRGMLGGAPVIRSRGRLYPVETLYLGRASRRTVAADVADAVRTATNRHEGSVLAFLPGEAEIGRAEELLHQARLGNAVDVLPLYGALQAREQDQAIAPSPPGRRKVVLATTIAETSLTIEGISIVIDGGFKRVPQFDPGSGMTRLETVRVSASAAEQRRGRAGRMRPGICYRMWPEPEMKSLVAHDTPEILQADLASFLLDLALWGVADPIRLKLLDQPPAGAVAQAKDLLKRLDAIDAQGRITPHGKKMARLPLHPRLAHMVIAGRNRGEGGLAADIAALLQERDILKGHGDANVFSRLELLRRGDARLATARRAAEQIRKAAKIETAGASGDAGGLIALAYSERIASARDKRGAFRMASGGGAVVEESDPLSKAEFLAIATTDGKPANARIFLATPITRERIEELFADRIEKRESVRWDRRMQSVSAKIERRLDGLVLEERPIQNPDPELLVTAMMEGVNDLGLDALSWNEAARSLQERVMIMKGLEPEQSWPDLTEEALARSVGSWLRPYLYGKTRFRDLAGLDLKQALGTLVPPPLLRLLHRLLPEHIALPSGSSVAIDYKNGVPTLRVKVQELFGERNLPELAGGKLKLRIELLSPAGRPVGVTDNLESFWRTGYSQVRSEMRGRYPKHDWPEDPVSAAPSRGRKPRASRP
jgi:ATP-dependent helicase HrpB